MSRMVSLACILFWMPRSPTIPQSANSILSGCFEAEVGLSQFRHTRILTPWADHYQWIKKDLENHLSTVPPHLDITFNFHVTQYSPIEGTLLEKVATLTRTTPAATADTSSSEGYNSSSPAESINEKERDLDDKFRGEEGKEGLIHWHQGRANLENVIKQAVAQAQGPVSVNGRSSICSPASAADASLTVCGPSTLQNAVRTAVRTTSGPAKVLKEGQAPVEFHCENFGW